MAGGKHHPCGLCAKNCTKTQESIKCTGQCKDWNHLKCVEAFINKHLDASDPELLNWKCSKCASGSEVMLRDTENSTDNFEVIINLLLSQQKEIEALRADNTNIRNELIHIKNLFENLEPKPRLAKAMTRPRAEPRHSCSSNQSSRESEEQAAQNKNDKEVCREVDLVDAESISSDDDTNEPERWPRSRPNSKIVSSLEGPTGESKKNGILPVLGLQEFHMQEVEGDIFSLTSASTSLAHCVSKDLLMAKGIAAEFHQRFGRRNELLIQKKGVGEIAVLRDGPRFIYYLITKEIATSKPNMCDLKKCLRTLRQHCTENKVASLAIPRLGCGLDKLDWQEVKEDISKVFVKSNTNVVVYYLPPPWRKENIIIGDSLLKHVEGNVTAYGNARKTTVESYPGIRIEQLAYKLRLLKMQGENFKRITVHVGTNNVRSSTPDEIAAKIKTLMEEGKKTFPNARWVISGVLCRRDTDDRYIEGINQCLDALAKENGYVFIDGNFWITNDDLGRDGLHLNRGGATKLSQLLSTAGEVSSQSGN